MTKEFCSHCSAPPSAGNPDHSAQLKRLSRIAGQVEGIRRMITEREYCPDIMLQVSAVRAALKGLNAAMLKEHIGHCVREAFQSGDPTEIDRKTLELIDLFKREID